MKIKSILFCAAILLSGATTSAQSFSTLLNFEEAFGVGPVAALTQGPDGAFYGVTKTGGSGRVCCGVVFRGSATGAGFVLHLAPTDGIAPDGQLVVASNGHLYGTTTQDGSGGNGQGDIFEIDGKGNIRVLYTFCLQVSCVDGSSPEAGLVQSPDGFFYGTTTWGGANLSGCSGIGCGTVFKVSLAGELTTLYSFCSEVNCADGTAPGSTLTQGADGNFYGTTPTGGSNVAGTIFKISPTGRFTTIYSFCSQLLCTDGNGPAGALTQGSDGNFYGTTLYGGSSGNGTDGTAFRISPGGQLTTLHNFCDVPDCPDGFEPEGLILASDGNFYGVTRYGGAYGWGTVFEMSPVGAITTLHNFNDSDGGAPIGGLLQETTGVFYGTTSMGGDLNCGFGAGCGTVFSLDTGLAPFATFVRKGAKVGQVAEILGQGFTGATKVFFAGIPASFTVRSDTFLTATVPEGATTGYVTVNTPGGDLTSNVEFRVIP